ncbi:HlyD family secretion protein [Modicisalibacter luteus]|uniref:HlyD family secretion protein n=1 Tax=Modicisalibacter luteus TaxID=453962 RepID=A0ABV7LXA7_9GAMM|nr:HlyD family secretion protein [Halomonas lutea]GHB15237.1 secretion protein [Halomonas lutea]
MAPEQSFKRWVRLALLSFLVLFAYFILADLFMPLTPQARVMRPVTQIAPEVSGNVVEVSVTNNAHVEAGEVLFRLDTEPFRIALNQAKLNIEQAARENARLDASIAAARAQLIAVQVNAEELAKERRRLEKLLKGHDVSRQKYDQVAANAKAAQAEVEAAQARVNALEVQRGEQGSGNLRMRQARNALAEAKLNLSRATVRAPLAGVISNLQLEEGAYIRTGAPVLALIGETADIVANLREKSLRHVEAGDPAQVVFDAWPGQVFAAQVLSVDAGVREGQILANGQLVSMPETNRWVRDAQRMRVHLALEEEPDAMPASGARATVQLAAGDNSLAAFFAWAQIRLVSWLRYVY